MRTQVEQDDSVVSAAEAIVQAEWLRLRPDEHADEDVPEEDVTLRMSALQADSGSAFNRRPAATPLRPDGLRTVPAYPPHHVWATQRSPP